MNRFEQKWIENVRFEIYFVNIVQTMMDNLKLNVKMQKHQRSQNLNRCYHFLHRLKAMAEKTHGKVRQLTAKFDRRKARLIKNILQDNVLRRKHKRQND